MPPKRKALETSDANVAQGQTSAKKAKPDGSAQPESNDTQTQDAILKEITKKRENRWSKVSGSKNLDADYWFKNREHSHAYEFVCQCNPFRRRKNEDDDESEDDDDDDDAPPCDRGETCPCTKTAASQPSHPYTFSRAGVARFHVAGDMANLRNPDTLNMYTYNDHAAYGVLEVVHNMLLDFDEAWAAGDAHEAWAIVEGMALFMLLGSGSSMVLAEDSDTVAETVGQICRMVLTALSMLNDKKNDKGKFKDGATVYNLSWMMSLYHRVAEEMRGSSVLDRAATTIPKTFKFRAGNFDLYLNAFAKHLEVKGHGAAEIPQNAVEKVRMPKLGGKDPWGWDKSFFTFKTDHATPDFGLGGEKFSTIGGDKLDISAWSSAERKKHSFDKKDPFPKDIAKKLKEGLCLTLA